MKIRVKDGQYGLGKVWTLECYGKSFYLGEDSIFCAKVLEMNPFELIKESRIQNLEPYGNEKLAKFISKKLGINRSNVNSFPSWKFSV